MPEKLDSLSIKILNQLQLDPLITHVALARNCLISASAAAKRRAKLESEKYIIGYVANLNFEKIGKTHEAVVFFKMSKAAIANHIFIEEQLNQIPDVTSFDRFIDFEYMVHVLVVEQEQLKVFLKKLFVDFKGLENIKSYTVTRKWHRKHVQVSPIKR